MIANAFLDRGQSLVVPTTPGRTIQFIGGHAKILIESDLPPVLRMSNATVVVEPDQIDWVRGWLDKCGEFSPPQCVIELPEGVKLYPPAYTSPARRGRPRKEDSDRELENQLMGWSPN